MTEEIHYFITVDWCKGNKRGIFCNKKGIGYWKERKHTEEEIAEILGHFWIILSPQSEPFTQEQLKKTRRWIPLAEYQNEYGIAIKED